jgi:prepilin-type processing-associated H-X9-DG protein
MPVVDDGRVMVNERVLLQDFEGVRIVLVDGNLFYRYPLGDRHEERFLVATLAHSGLAGLKDLSRAFGIDRSTVSRYRRRLEEEGARGTLPKKRGPKGPHTVTRAVQRQILCLKEQGLSSRAVGRRLGISERSVRRALEARGYAAPENAIFPAFGDSEQETVAEEDVSADDVDGETSETEGKGRPVAEAVAPRLVERALAGFGCLLEAAPNPESGENLRCAGVLLALPAILDLGVLETAKNVYRGLKPGFYGLRSFILTLLFMALLRVKRPEGLKELPPEVLGRHLGLDRSPEVKTVRRKLTEIARRGRSHVFLAETARRLAREHSDLMGFLYVDGHVRAYHGKRPREKTFVPRKRICMPATTDYWVNDADGDPFFFVTTEGHGGLAKVLPDLLAEVKGLLGEDRRVTVVFDRGGWKIEVLKTIRDDLGFDFITYRRKPFDDLPDSKFTKHTVVEGDDEVVYELADEWIELGKAGRVRLVVRKDPKTGEQIHIVTTREDLTAVEVVKRMVARWRQENYFKYAREEYALDAMVSYELVPADPERLVVNPKRREIEKQVRRQRTRVRKLERELAAKSAKPEGRPTLEGFKAAVWEIGESLAAEQRALEKLVERRTAIPKRVTLREALEHAPMRLEFERKTFTDTLKMMAYRAESGLAAAIAPHYRRADQEARRLIREAMKASGDLHVSSTEMHISLEPLSSPHRTAALNELCKNLSEQNAKYPGTDLVLRYSVRGG